jgi:hypothetical protein
MSAMTSTRPGYVEQRIRFGELYAQAEQFYARQLRLRVAGDAEGWADTFTPDAVLESAGHGEPARDQAAAAGLRCDASGRGRAGAPAPRHWIGKLEVRPQDDGTLWTRCSTLVHLTPASGGTGVLHVCVMEDVLVWSGGTWRTDRRRVLRDAPL